MIGRPALEINSKKIIRFEIITENMGTMELKSNLHQIVDKIDNEQLLRAIYEFIKQRVNSEDGQIWQTLTEEQKKEVYLSYEESENGNNLTDWDDGKKKP